MELAQEPLNLKHEAEILQFGRFLLQEHTVGLVLLIQIWTVANFTLKGKQISLHIKTCFFFTKDSPT